MVREACSATLFANATSHQFCVMTQLGQFVTSIQSALPFFGVVFYFANYAFIAGFLGFAIYSAVRTHREDEYQEMRDDYANI